MKVDFLIVGAGFTGLTLAERLSNELDASCLVVERRGHLGGNAYDEYDAHGVLVHAYGPHYFRSDQPAVVDYLSRFTGWRPANYQVLSWTRSRYWRFPINLNTFEQLVGRTATEEEFQAYLARVREPVDAPRNSEDVIVSQVGRELYELFFKGYTEKQWRRSPAELDASVCGRIPVRTNRDDRYLRERFQAMPDQGYTALFRRMLAGCRRTMVLLNADYREVRAGVECGQVIYSGAIDEYFGYRAGVLPYRSLRFEAEHFTAEQLAGRESVSGRPGFWQPVVQVNYPNDFDFTRIVEAKHVTGQRCSGTTIVREFPQDYAPGGEAYYPVPNAAARRQYEAYAELAAREPDTLFAGRLATYRYLNMDEVVAQALALAARIKAGWADRRRRVA
ncbi:UDP-galactopyranose mutase [Cyanobium sp. Morenito 9A2]|uniref:UDP-galactopyranose mutase n=1 Tax=Cyanobium sp. Morenito 9A2 TaxID=2823718 RepID=UPI0020CF45BD|nr:UDP-galactopyranose mutase [Cyanobium sp. Morenito 9A2]MCP9851251.1 UDP-galactopyranose mutase [Cyanobium sp. Morenito 9A2]